MKIKNLKALGIVATVLGGIVTIVADLVNDKVQDQTISEKIQEALADKE